MKDFFQQFFHMRWYFLFVAGVIALMSYANYTGWRLFSFGSNQQWSASGPGGHK
jgi:hypothetical protein